MIGDASFRVMCEMWGVDEAVQAVHRMGMAVEERQIERERQTEKKRSEGFKRIYRRLTEEEKKHEHKEEK